MKQKVDTPYLLGIAHTAVVKADQEAETVYN